MSDVPSTLGAGRYELRRSLGKGGTAAVFEAVDTVTGQPLAIKLLLGGGSGREGLRRRLVSEMAAMQRVTHPHVLRVYNNGSEQGIDFVVMALAPGGSLQDRLDAHGPLRIGEAIGFGLQVLAGLAAAHRAGVVHRDVKPQNVLLDENGLALLADFGIARVPATTGDARHTRAGVTMGSFAYMPPEQRLDAHEVDERADVYAAGATLYALLTAGNPVDLFTAGPDSVRWAGIPPALAEVLRCATAQEADGRYPSAGAFGRALAGVRDTLPAEVLGTPIVAFPDLPPPTPRGDAGEAWTVATAAAITFLSEQTEPRPVAGEVPPDRATPGGGRTRSVPTLGGSEGPAASDGATEPVTAPQLPTSRRVRVGVGGLLTVGLAAFVAHELLQPPEDDQTAEVPMPAAQGAGDGRTVPALPPPTVTALTPADPPTGATTGSEPPGASAPHAAPVAGGQAARGATTVAVATPTTAARTSSPPSAAADLPSAAADAGATVLQGSVGGLPLRAFLYFDGDRVTGRFEFTPVRGQPDTKVSFTGRQSADGGLELVDDGGPEQRPATYVLRPKGRLRWEGDVRRGEGALAQEQRVSLYP